MFPTAVCDVFSHTAVFVFPKIRPTPQPTCGKMRTVSGQPVSLDQLKRAPHKETPYV